MQQRTLHNTCTVKRASDFQPEDAHDLIEGHLVSDVVIVAGKKGTGKSQAIAHLAACITMGKEFVPGVKPSVTGEVAIFHGERSITKTLVRRLKAADADLGKVFLPQVGSLEEAAHVLRELLAAHPKVRLVVIDPLTHYLEGKSPTNAKARKLLKPFLDLCDRHSICVVLICHFTKSGNKDLIDLVGGSGGWTQAACSIWATAKVKDGFFLQHVECNTLDTTGQHWEYVVEPVDDGMKPATSRVVILGKSEVDISMALDLGKDMSITIPAKCALAIETMLKTDGPLPRTEVLRRLDAQGFLDAGAANKADVFRGRHTLNRAKEILQGKIEYIQKGRNTSWAWIAPESESESEQWDADSHG